MGDAIEEPDIQDIHPENLNEKTPGFITNIIYLASGIFSAYGWVILCVGIIGWILWKSSRDKYEAWRESAEYHKNPDKFIVRENALQASRQKMQEEYEAKARERALKLKEEEEKRKANSSHTRESDCKLNSSNSESSPNDKPKKPIKSFRPEFNPLMSDTRSCRPSWGRRRAGGG